MSSVSAAPDALSILDPVRPDLESVEARLESEVDAEVRAVAELGGHVLRAGGKRLRPAMVALAARAVSPGIEGSRVASVGASVELVHMATLIHDDVVDAAGMRRGQPTANALFGNGAAVLCGDFLLARAMRILAMDGDLRIIRTVSEITIEMSEGEVMEILATGDPDISLAHYLEILRKKTAVFVEGCCRCGAILAGADPDAEAALARCGLHLGMAFQIADDLLDYSGDPVATGKPVGIDLRDGRATLPFILAREHRVLAHDQLLRGFSDPTLPDATIERIVLQMEEAGIFEKCREYAREHVQLADSAISGLPPSPARQALQAVTDYVIQRDR